MFTANIRVKSGLILRVSRQANQLATDFVKSRVGRLRPDFLARCQFDFELNECTGDVRIVQEGRKSFPSGHSSQAFYGMIFLSLYLAGKNRAWSLEHTDSHTHLVRSRLYRSAVVIAPIFLSTYIAISRWDDHVHHPTDILAGCLLGTAIALSNYLIWWPSPFGSRNHVTMPTPRLHYAKPVVEREPADEQV
ncbi:uncharacterized protein L969DRAFT_86875 [Mixia osmundae IAM 14324]|uniref:uncharacterized protein n=1 Tax=Mixia osmundae (strain CBS 9802 / IAM 14324 / JCM 22182 / KY 12970) TaxID=764103 RepID=UPI0004A55307|nr:uncharacterized protein L969DRAFT_86875 [Mixia osmundae IAM 14324]KEI40242.1 hypothetical protein L969DRAFT_86875 [Mixia osmundae IAM 14324]